MSNWGNYDVLQKVSIEAFEEVATLAGKFMAFRIYAETILMSRSRDQLDEATYWYSPEVGQVIKARWGILKEFKRQ